MIGPTVSAAAGAAAATSTVAATQSAAAKSAMRLIGGEFIGGLRSWRPTARDRIPGGSGRVRVTMPTASVS
ncbi:hypothetical protein GCM10010432_21720 [Catellatospora methionotrophica]